MTKVIVSRFLLEYQHSIVRLARECLSHRFIQGVRFYGSGDPVLAQPHILRPPCIEILDLDFYEGKANDLILLFVSDDFGVDNVHLVLQDEEGQVIESGDAFLTMEAVEVWNYVTSVSVPAGSTVTVQAFATDQVGGVGMYSVTKPV